jgi:hypothetical protein
LFGDGIQILPGEDCLGLETVDRLVGYWASKALTHNQAVKAAGYIASRFMRSNDNEWRAYNLNAEITLWPTLGRRKFLLIPGSLNEVWGHSQWGSSWKHPLDAYDALIDHFKLDPQDLLLRAHPNWSEKIGKADGRKVEECYTQWAKKRGVHVISSVDKVSTLGLIEQADVVVIASGTAALEAGALGKQIIGISGANYQRAGMRDEATSEKSLKAIKLWSDLSREDQQSKAANIQKNTLRFAYTITHRIPQYVQYVQCISPTKYKYKNGADGKQLIDILKSGELVSDDLDYSVVEHEENKILDLLQSNSWEKLGAYKYGPVDFKSLNRRLMYRGLDIIRDRMTRGDR